MSHLIYISHYLNHHSSFDTAAPVIEIPSSSTVTVDVGDPLTLSCTSRGSPPDTFTWRKDNDPTVLQSTSITAVDHTNTSAVFRAKYSINSITISDVGTYTCTVTSLIGNDSAIITIVCKLLMLNKNTYGAKKARLIRSSSYLTMGTYLYLRLKALISAKAKNFSYNLLC